MMRENEVTAAAVEVKGIAEVLMAHGRAFDVPARTALPQGLSHAGSPGLAPFQRQSPWDCVYVVNFDAGAGFMSSRLRPVQFTVVVKFFNAVIDVVVDDVGIASSTRPCTISMMSSMCSGRGDNGQPDGYGAIHDVEVSCNVAVEIVSQLTPSPLAALMILSSTSVKFWICVTS